MFLTYQRQGQGRCPQGVVMTVLCVCVCVCVCVICLCLLNTVAENFVIQLRETTSEFMILRISAICFICRKKENSTPLKRKHSIAHDSSLVEMSNFTDQTHIR